jgi:hypothetical protein
MTELPLDFDSILAHLVPGLIAVVGIAFLSPPLQKLLGGLRTEHGGSTIILLTLIALVSGMLLSDIRVVALHPTCRLNLSWISHEPSFSRIAGEPVAYGKLVGEGRLNALQEAKRSEQTPYRFHGNTLLAVVVLVTSRITALFKAGARGTVTRRARTRGIVAAFVLLIVAFAVLYPAFRSRYYNYTNAIRAINAL